MVAWMRALLVIVLVCGSAAADKLDSTLDAYGDAYYKYEPMRAHYEQLRALYNDVWKPVSDQQEAVRRSYAAWQAALAKFGKGAKESNDAAYAYVAENKKLAADNEHAEHADPKHTATGTELDRYFAAMKPFKEGAESSLATVQAMFAEARKIGKTKVQRKAIDDELDKRLAAADERRAKQAASTRSPQADAANASTGTSSGNQGGGVHPTMGPAFQQLQGGGFH
jgi:hypothetical protein